MNKRTRKGGKKVEMISRAQKGNGRLAVKLKTGFGKKKGQSHLPHARPKARELEARRMRAARPAEWMPAGLAAERQPMREGFLNTWRHNFYSSHTVMLTLLAGQDQETAWRAMTLYSFSKCPKAN